MSAHPERKSSPPHAPAALSMLGLAMAVSGPGVLMAILGFPAEALPLRGLLAFGGAIIGAAFVLTWGAELAQLDIG